MAEHGGPPGGPVTPGADVLPDVRASIVDALFQHSRIGVVAMNLTGSIIDHDGTFAELVGLPGDDLRGTRYETYVHPSQRVAANANIHAVSTGAKPDRTADRLFVRPDGTAVWLRAFGVLMRDEAGRPTYTVGLVTDISEERRNLATGEQWDSSSRALLELQYRLGENAPDVTALCRVLVEGVVGIMGDHASIWLLTEPGCELSVVASFHSDAERDRVLAETLADQVIAVGTGLVGGAAAGAAPFVFTADDATSPPADGFDAYQRYVDRFGMLAVQVLPLRARKRVLGVLVLMRDETHGPYCPTDLAIATEVANYAALAIDSARLLVRAESEVARRRIADADLALTEAVHRQLLDTSPAAVVVHRGGIFLYANQAAMDMFRATDERPLVGTPILDRVQPEDKEWVRDRTVKVESGAGIIDTARDLQLQRLDGEKFSAWPVALPRLWDGEPAVQATLQDVTEKRAAEEALAARERFYSELLDSMAPVLVLDRVGRVLAFNRAWQHHLSQIGAPEFPVGANLLEACRAGGTPELRSFALQLAGGIEAVLAGDLDEFTMDVDHEYADATKHWMTVRLVPLFASGGGAVLHLNEVTERKTFELELARQATHDPLTGLPNRVLLQDRLEHALSARRVRRGSVAVLFVDIDHFKLINDSYGHETGDLVLVNLAARLLAAVRPGDTVARFAGDEFVVMMEDLPYPEDAVLLADRVLAGLRELSNTVPGADIQVSASIGIAIATGDEEAGDLLRSADTAMFEAKSHGRDCTVVFDAALSGRAKARLEMTQDLRHAVERGEFELHFQPLLHLADDSIGGAEALLRWQRPGHGMTPPDQFIPVAEDSGLIVGIGEWVIESATLWAAERMHHPTGPLTVSVNVAARQLGHEGFVEFVAAALARSGLPAELLTLELTESTVMEDPAAAVHVLDRLKALGVRLSIDDFGTGYSSLAYLQRLPMDELKIDRAFIDGLGTDSADGAIVASIVNLAHTLGLIVVAEGIESVLQLSLLQELGCERAQGYLISKPVDVARFDDWLASRVG